MDIKELEKIELERTEKLSPQKLKRTNSRKEVLKITYLMVWTKVCGGSKIILEYANRIQERGHKVTIVSYDIKPKWFNLDSNVDFIQVPENENLKDYIPDCDIIVATSWKNIYAGIESKKAPVVFFEQGGSHLFDNISNDKKQCVQNRISLVPYIHTVSSYAKDEIQKRYKRDSKVIGNAIDEKIFYPNENRMLNKKEEISITIIGSEEFKFKGIEGILKAVKVLKQRYDNIKLNWITQVKPEKNKEQAIVNPQQIEIGNILRETDIYICNSEYESFGLPTLEAMTCGATVVTTDTGGMRDFVKDNFNALVINKEDKEDMIKKVAMLIEDAELRTKLSENGIRTAKKFNWNTIVNEMIEYYREIATYKVEE